MQSQFAHRNGQDHSARHPIHYRDHSIRSVSEFTAVQKHNS